MRRAAKVDRNQAEIVAALRSVGASVQSLAAVGQGVPDLLCAYRGSMFLLEVKMPEGSLTPDQETWHVLWAAPVHVVRTPDEALQAIGAVEVGL